jgi:hypothetical protein
MSADDAATSLDRLLAHQAARRPDAIAIADPPDRSAFTQGAPRTLTYARLEQAVSSLANRLLEFELGAGSVVAVRLPNVVEAVVTLLAITRAGLAPALLPPHWDEPELTGAVRAAQANALITCGRCGKADWAATALNIAHDVMDIRYVCGFGPQLPDGFVPLDDIFEEPHDGAAAFRYGDTGLITFELRRQGPLPVRRSHIELMAGGLAVTLEAGVPRHGTILSTITPGSFASVATAVVPWLFGGGRLLLHHPFNADSFVSQLGDDIDCIALPGPVIEEFLQDERCCAWANGKTVLSLCQPEHWTSPPREEPGLHLVNVLRLGEWAIAPRKRSTPNGMLREGPWGGDVSQSGAPTLLHLSRTMHQTIAVTGAMVPYRAADDPTAHHSDAAAAPVDTGIPWPTQARTESVASGPLPLEALDMHEHIEAPRAAFG